MDFFVICVIFKNNNISLNVRLEVENVWLTQANLVELYQSSKSNVSEHIKHIFIVQNKLHYDAHGHTAAEIIFERADSNSSGVSRLFSYYGSFCLLEKSILSRKGGTAKEKSV